MCTHLNVKEGRKVGKITLLLCHIFTDPKVQANVQMNEITFINHSPRKTCKYNCKNLPI